MYLVRFPLFVDHGQGVLRSRHRHALGAHVPFAQLAAWFFSILLSVCAVASVRLTCVLVTHTVRCLHFERPTIRSLYRRPPDAQFAYFTRRSTFQGVANIRLIVVDNEHDRRSCDSVSRNANCACEVACQCLTAVAICRGRMSLT